MRIYGWIRGERLARFPIPMHTSTNTNINCPRIYDAVSQSTIFSVDKLILPHKLQTSTDIYQINNLMYNKVL
jgi:hypothetical protein